MPIVHPRFFLFWIALAGLSACSAPPKPLVLDGRHRMPVNTAEARAVYEAGQITPAPTAETGQ
ncbi:hypothetical protein AEYBE204_09740 [Asticcacaulis sp. YBE204]|nr:hypothetical protein AEYBE204_09740 [Asticcacaulis sp. YBE204]